MTWWKQEGTTFDYMVVVPTMGAPELLPMTAERMLRQMDGTRTLLVLSVNPKSVKDAARALERVKTIGCPDGCEVLVVTAPGPLGFAKAVNTGLAAGIERAGVCATTIILNDDVLVTPGWQQGLRAALDAREVRVLGEPPGPNNERRPRDAARYGRIGLAGPSSDVVAGDQHVGLNDPGQEHVARDLDGFAAWFRKNNALQVITTDFLSGFCIALERTCLLDLAVSVRDSDYADRERPTLFDERFGIGGFEDNDLTVRASLQGWRSVIAAEVFVRHIGHQSLDKHFKAQLRGMRNRLTYYRKWAEERKPAPSQRLVALYRVGFTFAQDLHLLRGSISRASRLVDGIAIVLTSNPIEIAKAYDWPAVSIGLSEADATFLNACSNDADSTAVGKALEAWVRAILDSARADTERVPALKALGPVREQELAVAVWTGEWNERDERNRAIELAETLQPDWLFSIDHDEVVEDRIRRSHLERYMSHPDPLVLSWDVGWLNHWDTPRLCRVDPPWSDGDRYASGMRGFRIWRSLGRRILSGTDNGLHCGNSPDVGTLSKRISALRFRHYGYVHAAARLIKQRRYVELDKSPDPNLTGNSDGYAHLTAEEGMRLSPYVQNDGIGFSMLVHAGEQPEDVARHLDLLYGVVDRIVLVWTDEGAPTGELEEFAQLFGVEWVLERFDGNLAHCRNAGLARLRSHGDIAWAFILDPDERFQGDHEVLALRRMAECSDSFGFIVRFANHRPPEAPDQDPTYSENIRFLRLDTDPDPQGCMWFSGFVHEGFDEAMERLREEFGIHPQIRVAPFVVGHWGLAKSPDDLEAKLQKYTAMLLEDLRRDPGSCGSWTSLGLQYANEGRDAEALVCYERGVAVAGRSYLPYKELGTYHLRQAMECYRHAVEYLNGGHWALPGSAGILQWLQQQIRPMPKIGRALIEPARPREMTLGWLPDVWQFIAELQAIHGVGQVDPIEADEPLDDDARAAILASVVGAANGAAPPALDDGR